MLTVGICRYLYCVCILFVVTYQVSGNQLQLEERYRRGSGNNRCVVFQTKIGGNVTNFTNKNREVIYEYRYPLTSKTTVYRITVSALKASNANPVLFVVRQQHIVMSWKVPFTMEQMEQVYTYNVVSRNMCPFQVTSPDSAPRNQTIFVDVYSFSLNNTDFDILVDTVEDFNLRTDEMRQVNITPSEPQYFMYTFPDDVDSVTVQATSDSDLCMIFSVQDIECPVFDLEQNVEFSGIHQTLTKKGAITVKKSTYNQNSFYIVTVLKPSDYACSGEEITQAPDYSRRKHLTLKVYGGISDETYILAITAAVVVYTLFYLILCRRSIEHCKGDGTARVCCSVAREPQASRDEFCWNLLSIGIFYGLPVIQLVLTYQTGLESSGDQDICYYNFDCSRPLGVLSSFNNVFSNIGYIMLGILFLLVVCKSYRNSESGKENQENRKERIRQGAVEELSVISEERTVDDTTNRRATNQKNGSKDLFYALGLGLVMEGVMSGCYHVCPSRANFQFDTSFMYILTCLSMLLVFRSTIPELRPKAHKSYLVMAFVVLITVIGVLFGTNIFWILFGILDLFVTLCLHLYYYHIYERDKETYCSVFPKIYECMRKECKHTSKPNCSFRLWMLIIATVLNSGLAIYGIIMRPSDFATFLLAIFIGNLLLHVVFYFIFRKFILKKPTEYWKIACCVIALISWFPAIYFFIAHLTSWGLTPAQSREGNRSCMLLDFYDAHDIWHFLSAFSLFMSFLVLLITNEDLESSSDLSMHHQYVT